MALQLYDVNYLAIIICLVVHMVLGFLWYSKVLFQETWIKLAKISDAQMRQGSDNMGKTMLIATVAGFILIFMLAQTIKGPEVVGFVAALELAFWLWLGFIATVLVGPTLWEGKPWKLYLINSSYYLVSMVISSLVLYFWN